MRWLVISYPSVSTHGRRTLAAATATSLHQLIDGLDWPLTELLFEGEIVFIIDRLLPELGHGLDGLHG
ncbi:MAG: hypothetical protein R3D55_17575 [Chloroflexota bacterium]